MTKQDQMAEDLLAGLLQADQERNARRLGARMTAGGLLSVVTSAEGEDTSTPDDSTPRMDFTLGLAGDLAWMLLPETRSALVRAVQFLMTAAMDMNREIYALDVEVYNAVKDVVQAALQDPAGNDDLLRRCCRYVLAVSMLPGASYGLLRWLGDDELEVLYRIEPRLIEIVAASDW